SLRHYHDQVLYPHRSKRDPALPLRHGAETDVELFFLDPQYDLRCISHGKTEVHLQLFMRADKITDQPGHKLTPQSIDISQLDQTLCLSCQRAHLLDPRVQRLERLIDIFPKKIPVFCQDYIAALLLEQL